MITARYASESRRRTVVTAGYGTLFEPLQDDVVLLYNPVCDDPLDAVGDQ